MPPFIEPTVTCLNKLKDKWLLFDACTIIGILKYDATNIFHVLNGANVICCYIQPVQLELLNTNSSADVITRSELLVEYFEELPFNDYEIKQARIVQNSLPVNVQPSIIDLYLAGVSCSLKHDKLKLITSNVRDFPYPLFERLDYIVLQDERASQAFAILEGNPEKLIQVTD